MNRYFFKIILFLTACSIPLFTAAQYKLWSNPAQGFAAQFPNEPKLVKASTSTSTGYAYQSNYNFKNGGVLYAITVVPIDKSIDDSKRVIKRFIEESNKSFILSMGQDPRHAKLTWGKFGDGRPKLIYEFHFKYSGAVFSAIGFWIEDNRRLIRISTSFTGDLTYDDLIQVNSFPDSFVLLERH